MMLECAYEYVMGQIARLSAEKRNRDPGRSGAFRQVRRDAASFAGNQARLRSLRGGSLNPNDSVKGRVATVAPDPMDAGVAVAAQADPANDAGKAVPVKDDGANKPAAPGCKCEMKSGPAYTPTGDIPVDFSGGQARASFDLNASFATNPATGAVPSCCHVRQYIKWDQAFANKAGGPPHAGFPAATAPNTWIEDRGPDDTERYGYRSGPHSVPFPDCGDEYKTGARRDMANGDRYCGKRQAVRARRRRGDVQVPDGRVRQPRRRGCAQFGDFGHLVGGHGASKCHPSLSLNATLLWSLALLAKDSP
jgi:hypothetical protein